MQQLVILLLTNCSSTCFGRLYAHPQEVRLRFHCICLSVLLWLLWCWRVGWQAVCTVWSRLQGKTRPCCISWSYIYLLIKDARSLKHKAVVVLQKQFTFETVLAFQCKSASFTASFKETGFCFKSLWLLNINLNLFRLHFKCLLFVRKFFFSLL